MTTSQIIAQLKRLNPGNNWTNATLLDIIDQVVQLLCYNDGAANYYFDSTTGDLPFLSTTAGTYQYSLSNVYKVKEIVVKQDLYNFGNEFFLRNYGDNEFIYNKEPIKLHNWIYYPVPVIKEEVQGNLTQPRVTFRFDPGTAASTYRVLGYVAPTTISSVNIQIPIAAQFHSTVFIPACQALIDAMENGRYEEKIEYIDRVLKAKLLSKKARDSEDDDYTKPMGW